MPPTSSNIIGKLEASHAIGIRRDTPGRHIVEVSTNGQHLFDGFRALAKQLLAPRIRRHAAVPANDLQNYIQRCSNAIARQCVEGCALVLRSKLEHYDQPELAHRLFGESLIQQQFRYLITHTHSTKR